MSDRRDSARVLLFDAGGRLVLIRRTRPGVGAYLTTPGGAIEPGETATGAAIRECVEELGATIRLGRPVHVIDDLAGSQVFFLARLLHADPLARTGPEFTEPHRGGYRPTRR